MISRIFGRCNPKLILWEYSEGSGIRIEWMLCWLSRQDHTTWLCVSHDVHHVGLDDRSAVNSRWVKRWAVRTRVLACCLRGGSRNCQSCPHKQSQEEITKHSGLSWTFRLGVAGRPWRHIPDDTSSISRYEEEPSFLTLEIYRTQQKWTEAVCPDPCNRYFIDLHIYSKYQNVYTY